MPRQFRSQRRKTQWAGMGDTAGAAVLPAVQNLTAGTAVILSRGAIIASGTGFVDEEVTITRTLGNVTAGIRVATAGSDAAVAVGLAVARNEAVTAGVGSLPSPESDPDFEWLYYDVMLFENGPQTANVGADNCASMIKPFDVRGQRILRTGYTLVWLAESQTMDAFCGVGGRYLAKLS